MAGPKRQALLTLDTFVDRDFITVDAKRYDLVNIDEFSVVDRMRLGKSCQRYGELEQLAGIRELDRAELNEMEDLLSGICRALFKAPATVHAKLLPGQRIAIVATFFELLLKSNPKLAAAIKTMIGEKSLPVSAASTGAHRKAG